MIFFTIVFAIQSCVSGLLLKAACWLHNYFFVSSELLTRVTANTAASVTTQTAEHDVASEVELTNPFTPPRQTDDSMVATNREGAIVVPTVGVSIGLGFLLTGLQLVGFGFALIWPLLAIFKVVDMVVAAGLALVLTFIITAALVSDLLTKNFNRGAIVTGIYFALLFTMVAPLIVLKLVFSSPL